jgi:hypothetical protein
MMMMMMGGKINDVLHLEALRPSWTDWCKRESRAPHYARFTYRGSRRISSLEIRS